MKNEIKNIAEAAAALHMAQFVNGLAESANEFIKFMNPAESEEMMNYIRSVLNAVDEVVLVATMQQDNDEARAMLEQATELQIANLIHMHQKNEVKH